MAVPTTDMDPDIYTDLLTFTFGGLKPYNPNQTLFIDAENPSRSFTAAQFRQLVRTLISGLKAHNVQLGDCVLLHLGNSILYPALFFSIIGAGGIYMGSNPSSLPKELDHILTLAEPKLILTTREALPSVVEVSADQGIPRAQICLVDEFALDNCARLFLWREIRYSRYFSVKSADTRHSNFVNLLSCGECDWLNFNDSMVSRTTPAAMFSTSGTGGLPKAAILSHHAIISQHRSIYYDVLFPVRRLMPLPMFHLFGALWTHLFPIRYGHPLFVLPRYEVQKFLSAVHRYQISETYLVPAIIHSLNQSPLQISDYLSSIRYIGVAGAPIDAASIQQFRSHLNPTAYACQIWGMTEVGATFQTRYGQSGDPGSIGTCLPGYEIRLIKQDGKPVQGDGEPGELYVRGPSLLTGYRGCTDALEPYGWFRTGDLAYSKQGQFYIIGRTKELIKVRGWQVAPAEIEAVLLQHPGITEAAVIGLDRPGLDEVPRAFVVRSRDPAGTRLTSEEVYNHALYHLARYKALDGGVFFVEKIPRTASSKIQRFKLSQMSPYREMAVSLPSGFEGNGAREPKAEANMPPATVTPER
ncbi:hypothetical protein PENANT_c076G00528 [Penicillium antarcticum]|uniref:AMP-dependent synthetase/ligase domain-containing protein n=1 Tax=Penicillium antarcticum TaxID=416450 RepID=A0A1V6PPB8_9EURO|nr:uncharacterized protein N7508_011187 [Penicillium antarcticum]KAJ5288412.1 hypothetical protein N7508_011187 [Penicillium antarcticum]OQD78848.1 hypothetical protein PENANT_c076G00528 [Penicillium antarcticum]